MRTIDALRIKTALKLISYRLGRLTNDYQKDPDPDHWHTINGAKVHLDNNGNYDGGAGGKFNGKHHWGGPDWKEKSAKVSALTALMQKMAQQKQNNSQNVAPQATSPVGISATMNNEEQARARIDDLKNKLDSLIAARNAARREYLIGGRVDKDLEAECIRLDKEQDTIENEIKNTRNAAAANGVLFISQPWHELEEGLDAHDIEKNPPGGLIEQLSSKEIIRRIAGGDKTKGSCASVALAYVANKAGLSVLDFRGGCCQQFFSLDNNLQNILKLDNIKSETHATNAEAGDSANILLSLPKNKEFFFATGKHAAIVKNTDNGPLYLELQSEYRSGWQQFGKTTKEIKTKFHKRFGCRYRNKHASDIYYADVDSMTKSEELSEIAAYFNTNKREQQKGVGGRAK